MTTAITIISLIIWFGGSVALLVYLFIKIRSIDKENKEYHSKVEFYLDFLFNKRQYGENVDAEDKSLPKL